MNQRVLHTHQFSGHITSTISHNALLAIEKPECMWQSCISVNELSSAQPLPSINSSSDCAKGAILSPKAEMAEDSSASESQAKTSSVRECQRMELGTIQRSDSGEHLILNEKKPKPLMTLSLPSEEQMAHNIGQQSQRLAN